MNFKKPISKNTKPLKSIIITKENKIIEVDDKIYPFEVNNNSNIIEPKWINNKLNKKEE